MCVCVWKVRDCCGSIVVLFNTVWDGLSSSVTGLRLVLSGRPVHSLTDFWQLRWVYCVLSPLNVQTPAPRLRAKKITKTDLVWCVITDYCRELQARTWTHLTDKCHYDNSFNVFHHTHIYIFFSLLFFYTSHFFPCTV